MKMFGTVLGAAFGLALLAAFLAGGYFLVMHLVGAFSVLEPQARALTAIACVTALLSAAIIAQGMKVPWQNTRQDTAGKTATYERLLASCCEPERLGEQALPAANDEFARLERALVLRGSGKVISAYLELKRLARQGGAMDEPRAALLKMLVTEMRRDLGSQEFLRDRSEALALLLDRGHE